MTTKSTLWIVAIGLAITIIPFGIVAYIARPSNSNVTDTVGTLALIGGVAVGIERVLEIFWTALGSSRLGTYWPMDVINKQMKDLENGLVDAKGPLKEIETSLRNAAGKDSEGKTPAGKALGEISTAIKTIQDLKNNLPVGEQRANLIAVTAMQGISKINKIDPKQIETLTPIANQSIVALADFAASFKDNPGKRTISIFVGGFLGIAIAGLFGLDVFKAILGTTLAAGLGVALTGLVMGLGSNPTHEIINLLQAIKTNRQQQNGPELSTGGNGQGISLTLNPVAIPVPSKPQGQGVPAVPSEPPSDADSLLKDQEKPSRAQSAPQAQMLLGYTIIQGSSTTDGITSLFLRRR